MQADSTAGEGRRITTKEALVHTTAVEIRTLTINGKQLTLAVFRQLQEEPLVNPDTGGLRGLPWGRVNYHPGKCAEHPRHLHVVWQTGEELRRAYVAAKWPLQDYAEASVHAAQREAAQAREKAREKVETLLRGWLALRALQDGPGTCPGSCQTVKDARATYVLSIGRWTFTRSEDSLSYPLTKWWHYLRDENGGRFPIPETEGEMEARRHHKEVAAYTESLRPMIERAATLCMPGAPDERELVRLERSLDDAVVAMKAVECIDDQPAVQQAAEDLRQGQTAYAETFRQLLATDQLFIAV